MSDDATLDEFTDTSDTKEGRSEEKKSRFWGEIPTDWNLVDGSNIYEVNPNPDPVQQPNTYIEMDALNTELPFPDYFGERNASEYSGKTFTQGDTLFARITPCTENGKAALVPEIETKVGIGSTEFAVLSPESDTIHPWFLYYINKSHPVHNYAVSRMRGSTGRQRVPFSVFRRELDFPLPSLSEQRKIATVLHTVDQAIQKTEEIIEQSKKLKRGMKQNLLSEGYHHHETEQCRIGAKLRKIPSEWETAELGELAEYQNGYGFSKGQWSDTGRLIIRIQDLTTPKESDMNYFDGEIDSKYEVENGDILVSWSATLGVFRWNRGDAVLNQHIFKVRNIEDIVSEQFLYHILDYSLTELERKLHGSTMKHVTRSAFEGTEVPLPPKNEQIQIAKTLDDIDQQIQSQKKHRSKLQKVKHSLMQDLLSGEVRTTDVDIDVPEEVAKYG